VNLLGFDCSTAACAVCVVRSDGAAFEAPHAEPLAERPAHGRELLAAIVATLERSGIAFSDLDAIAVGVGPGGFTGLRIGISTAHGLALAHGTPLRPVSSLAALAAGIDSPLALPLIDARRGELFGALYENGERRWEPFALTPEDLATRLAGEASAPLAAGDGALRYREPLERAGLAIAGADAPAHRVSAAQVCRLAEGVADRAPEAVRPDYVREPDARPNS